MTSMDELLTEHFSYLADADKLRCYRAALQQVVRPGDVVLDLGCGSGVLGLVALEAGAGFVYFLDRTAILEVAKLTVAGAGLTSRAAFLNVNSFQATLPEKADVIVCDHVGYFGVDYGIRELLADGRARFLKPSGMLVPRRLEIYLGLVDEAAVLAKRDAWQAPEIPPAFHWLRTLAANRKHAVGLRGDDLLGDAVRLDSLLLGESAPEFLSWAVELVAGRDGLLGGLLGWFRAELAEGVWMSNAPTDAQAIRRPQALLPLETPIAVKAGDRIKATVMARPDDHLISWRVEHPASGQSRAQSTLKGELLTPADLQRQRPDRRPRLSPLGHARRIVLDYCDGQRSAAEIERLVVREHPNLMPSKAEILRLVAQTLGRHTE